MSVMENSAKLIVYKTVTVCTILLRKHTFTHTIAIYPVYLLAKFLVVCVSKVSGAYECRIRT